MLTISAIKDKKPITFYQFLMSPFGESLVAEMEEKICFLAFPRNREEGLNDLKNAWGSEITEKKSIYGANKIFTSTPSINLVVKGTDFQIKVWQFLLKISFGSTISYEGLAHIMGKPTATRAVANAVAKNEIAFLIPCHRVISKNGEVHKYRWGKELKKEIISWESTI